MAQQYVVHRCQLYKPSTSAINSLAYEPEIQKLALTRADGTLYVYDTKFNQVLERVFTPVENGQSETVIWCKKRLFTVGAGGFLTEWSLHSRLPISETKLSASPVWCCVKSKDESTLFVGTEDGAILRCKVENEPGSTIILEKPVARTNKRILSLAVHQDGKILASGSLSEIKIWDLQTNRCLHRITVSKRQHAVTPKMQGVGDRDTLIWSLIITKDLIVASGDSRGVTSFWSATTGTFICEFESHKADVLTLAYDETQNHIYSSGIDPTVVQFIPLTDKLVKQHRDNINLKNIRPIGKIESADRQVTVYLEGARFINLHKRDVRALVFDGKGCFFSGGVDTILVKKTPHLTYVYPVLEPDRIKMAPDGKLALFQYDSHVDVWQLAVTNSTTLNFKCTGQMLNIQQGPRHTAKIKTSKSNRILASTIDRSGDYVAYSDRRKTTVLKIVQQSNNIEPTTDAQSTSLEKLTLLAGIDQLSELPPSDWLCFSPAPTSPDGDDGGMSGLLLLLACDEEKTIFVYEVTAIFVKLKTRIEYPDKNSYIRKIIPLDQSGSPLLACLTSSHEIFIVDLPLKNKSLPQIVKLPKAPAIPIDFRFQHAFSTPNIQTESEKSTSGFLIIVYSDGTLIEYDLSKNGYSDWTKRFLASHSYSHSKFDKFSNVTNMNILGLCPATSPEQKCFLFGCDQLISIKKQDKTTFENDPPFSYSMNSSFPWLVHFEQLANGQMVAVQIDKQSFNERLPEPFKMKRFGKN